MRVLQVHNRYRAPGGEDAVVRSEASLLRAGGHDVSSYEVDNPSGGLATAAALVTAPWSRRHERELTARIHRTRPDVVHVHNTWFTLTPAVVTAARRAGTGVVVSLHNYRLVCPTATLYRDGRPCTDCVGRTPWPGVVHRCYRDSVIASGAAAATIVVHRRRGTWERDVDRFVAPSRYVADRLADVGVPADRLVVKPNPVADPGARAAPPSSGGDVLLVGRLVAEKGVSELAEAWARARPAGLRLTVVGEGPERRRLEGVAGVQLLGHVPAEEVRTRMSRARAVVVPSRWPEPFGLVAVEAMAAGTAVVGSTRGAIPDLLGDGAGWLVDPEDDEAFVAALRALADDAAVDAAGRTGRARYEARFSPAAAGAALEAVYAAVVGR